MRIVVFSDSHGSYRALRQVVLAQPEAEVFLHLGDGVREFSDLPEEFPGKLYRGVAGNCDWDAAGYPLADLLTLGKKRVYFTHGHSLDVKAGLGGLLNAARGVRAHIVLYGHTHIARTDYVDGIYLMNPGSVSHPRQSGPTYGVIDITSAGIVTKVLELPHSR